MELDNKEYETRFTAYKYHILVTYIKYEKYLTHESILNFIKILEQEQLKMNKVNLIGNLTRDVELTTTQNGISVAKFTIAIQRTFANANGEYEADFINCVAWRNQAENTAKYCHKGDKIAISGAIQTRTYEHNDGTKRTVTEVIADSVEFISTKKNTETEMQSINNDDYNLPF